MKHIKIFLSYSHANSDVVDIIDQDLTNFGIPITRDIRDIGYRESIKNFMHRVETHDYVLMVLSDEFLKSESCMYEVSELLNTQEFEKRILPINFQTYLFIGPVIELYIITFGKMKSI